ncbi:hypothetical protein TorRG33x02_240690 [Trema orientale]|uniref:Uncharacterized protein n=1 Tax=Trema orientale TaxID=63057 RepID=A0A2P5DUY6_TREOI|nr:hypothetical protein TorRG33x02_240690 [Trema orientale]
MIRTLWIPYAPTLIWNWRRLSSQSFKKSRRSHSLPPLPPPPHSTLPQPLALDLTNNATIIGFIAILVANLFSRRIVSCPYCLSPISSFNISESIIRSLQDPPIWDSNSDDTRHSATPPDDHRTDHVATTPLMPDDDHHHTTVVTPSASLDYIDRTVTSHIFADDQHHTATTVPPDYNDDHSIADADATPGVSEDDHHTCCSSHQSRGRLP